MFQLERFSIMFQSEHISPMFRWEHFAAETGLSFPLLEFPAAAGGADVVEGDGAGAEENEGEGEGGQSKGEFASAVAHQSVVEVDLGDGYGQIDADGKSSHASEQAQQDEQAAEEFSEGREVGGPGRESEAGDELGVVLQSAENFVVSVIDYDGAKSEAHHEERERLQAVEVDVYKRQSQCGIRLPASGVRVIRIVLQAGSREPDAEFLLQHHLIAFLQSLEHFRFRAIRDPDVDRDLILAVLALRVGNLH